ncbi:MAG TPA: hypothetical protein VK174_07745 [Chitinophagales bacterium]|nr:hypothetical protein [Chitinophagales bacterium]
MSPSAKSVFYFGVYLVVLGIALIVQPNLLLGLFNIVPTYEVWIRVVGMLLLALSVYYIVFSRNDVALFCKITVIIRSTIILFFTAFTLLGWVQPAIILFSVIDLLGAIWTGVLLKKEGKW